MKHKSKISKKSKNRPPYHAASSATPERWTMPLEPREQFLISAYVDRCLVVIQNRGPGTISFRDSVHDRVELRPGKLLVTSAGGQIDVESKDDSAVIELQFIPTGQ